MARACTKESLLGGNDTLHQGYVSTRENEGKVENAAYPLYACPDSGLPVTLFADEKSLSGVTRASEPLLRLACARMLMTLMAGAQNTLLASAVPLSVLWWKYQNITG